IFENRAFDISEGLETSLRAGDHSFQSIPDAIIRLIPENPLASMISGEMLSIVIFTIIIGVAILQLPKRTVQSTLDLFHAIQEICMTIVSWAMYLVPYAVFGLLAQLTASIGLEGLAGIGYYVGIVLLGLLLLLVFYLVLVATIGAQNPFDFMRSIREVQLLAFSTTSSAAVMPLSMKTADEKLGVSSKVSDLVIPVGTTINMDGTALFQCISSLFIAQAYGMEMTIGGLMIIMVTIVASSIGTPAIPGGGVVILASVLESVGIPTEGLIIIIGVDRILGMFRCAVNVTGDLTACVIFNKWQERERVKEKKEGVALAV
ncbi:MAG: dicarboxylate/amino acid:cation symporter, partial [Bacteroidota bacterium]